MRSTSRLFMAAILLTLTAGVAWAQDPAPPPPAPPEVVQPPVVELVPIPVAEPVVPVVETVPIVETAPVVEPVPVVEIVPVVEPAVPAIVAPLPPEKLMVTTTTKRVAKKAKAPAEKPVIQEKPVVLVNETKAAPVAAAAAVDPIANTPPADAAANTVPPKSIAPAPPSVEVQAASVATKPEYTMGIGGWLLALLVVAALAGIITFLRRRRTQTKTSIVDLSATAPGLKPALAQRR